MSPLLTLRVTKLSWCAATDTIPLGSFLELQKFMLAILKRETFSLQLKLRIHFTLQCRCFNVTIAGTVPLTQPLLLLRSFWTLLAHFIPKNLMYKISNFFQMFPSKRLLLQPPNSRRRNRPTLVTAELQVQNLSVYQEPLRSKHLILTALRFPLICYYSKRGYYRSMLTL
jgi:hypothetical protein